MTRARDVANLIGSGNYSSTTFTATAGQTAFTISHTQGFVQVFMNGLLLDETVDYTSNGSAVTLTSGAAAGDEIEVVAYNTFSVGDALNQAAADTRYVNASGDTMSGDLTIDTNTFHVDVADNRVGIGTTAPTNNLTIIDGGATPYGADDTILLDIKRNTTNTAAANAVAIRLANNSNGFNIKYGGASDKLNISGGSGNTVATFSNDGGLTLPYQPSFYAYTSSDYTATGNLTGGNKWAERWDVGNNFSDGTFTAPIGGKYYFEVMWDANAIRSTIDIQVNTTAVIRYEPTGNTNDTWETHFYSGLIDLATNDSVRLYGNMHSQSSSYPFHMGSGVWGHFSGILLG